MDADLLALWERAAALVPLDRDDALLTAWDGPPPASLGERNAALLRLRTRLFGPAQALRCRCPACGETAEFGIDCEALAATLLPRGAPADVRTLEVEGHRLTYRLPDVHDLRALSAFDDAAEDGFAQALLQRCLLHVERVDGRPAGTLPATAGAALSQEMESLDPGASIAFEVTCPACRHGWSAPLDAGELVWRELQARAERLLLEVDTLARAYGWREVDVLALSPTRRAAYLQLARGSAP